MEESVKEQLHHTYAGVLQATLVLDVNKASVTDSLFILVSRVNP